MSKISCLVKRIFVHLLAVKVWIDVSWLVKVDPCVHFMVNNNSDASIIVEIIDIDLTENTWCCHWSMS